MQYHRIPHSSLEVSTLGLGTMTFGEQNSDTTSLAAYRGTEAMRAALHTSAMVQERMMPHIM